MPDDGAGTSGFQGGVRVAVGDVNGDGRADVICNNIGSSGQDGVSVIADFDRDGRPDVIASSTMSVLFEDQWPAVGDLDANARFRPAFFDVFTELSVWTDARRCVSGTCVTTEFDADFSITGATTMRCRAYNGLTQVADVTGIPMGMFAVMNDAMPDAQVHMQALANGALRCDWSWGSTNPVTIGGGGGGVGVMCDRIRIEPETPTIPIEIIQMQLTGMHICDLAVVDAIAAPPPACAADIAPPTGADGTVNVLDLLRVITSWGPCPAPCPPHCPADIVRDCNVNVLDLLRVITTWGPCPSLPN
jgi:hypothetical protein